MDALKLLAQKITDYPLLVSLLLKEAQLFLLLKKYELAKKVAKICTELCAESFTAWITLAEAYYHLEKYNLVTNEKIIIRQSLICLDYSPEYNDVEVDIVTDDSAEILLTLPNKQDSLTIRPSWVMWPQDPDYQGIHLSSKFLVIRSRRNKKAS